jgi:CheY-like chemotaxis protein
MSMKKQASPPVQEQLRIIVADDNADAVVSLCLLLEDDGHVLKAFHSGARVVDAVREFAPNVCILDIDMPAASGYAIARELKSLYGPARPFMIAISGKWFGGPDRAIALEAGFDYFIEKPADPRELSHVLEGVTQRLAAA